MLGSLIYAIIWMSPLLPLGHQASLRWLRNDGSTTCISEHELAAAVTARLGGSPKQVTRSALVIDGEIAPSATGWRVVIHTTDAHGAVLGQRELNEAAADCRAIDDKLVLVIALIVDPELLDAVAVPPVAPNRGEVVAPRAPWQFGASVAAVTSRGMLPGFGFGASVAAVIEPPHAWPLELGATLWPRTRGFAAPGGATFLQLTGGGALCPRLVARVSACIGAQAGELRATGFGYDQNESQRQFLFDATAELRLNWSLRAGPLPIGARIGVGTWVPLSRPRFVFRDAGRDVPIYQPAPASLVSELVLWAHF